MRIAVTRHIPEAGIERLRGLGEVDIWPSPTPPTREQLIEFARGADGLLTLLTERVDGALLDALPTVRVVSNMAVGYDNIDLAACTERGVAVCTTPEVLTDTTADFAFALILAVARRVPEAAESVRRGEWRTWEPLGFLGQDVHGATLGIVGMGRIGSAVARRAHGFGMRILYSDERAAPEVESATGARRVDLETLLRES
ncbi:MAG: D-glycerate dehydrogenase, partial [Thermomicrobiaceae bacterium]|nr:D-glycerate dehydrogenase [Thermomicrobiaceae bacterium]